MSYHDKRPKTKRVRGKSLINEMQEVSRDPVLTEIPTPPPPPQEETVEEIIAPPEVEAPTIEINQSSENITNEGASEQTLTVEEQQQQETSRVNRAIRNRNKSGNQKGSKRKRTVLITPPTPQGEPIPTPPPEPELIPIVTTLYDGANVRQFYGIKDTPIEEFISDVLKDVPLFKINGVDEKGNILNTYQVDNETPREPEGMSDVKVTAGGIAGGKDDGKDNGGKSGLMGGKNGGKDNNKSGKNKEDKFSIVKSDKNKRGSYKTKTPEEKRSLTEIVEEIQYNIAVDGVPGQPYPITYMGLENPNQVPQYMYEQPPIEPIPASLPESYQNSNNEGVEELKDGRRCANCIHYDPEVSVCHKWNAEVRQYYWCLSWQTMEPVIAEPNQFTDLIVEDGDIYDYFLTRVKNPTTQEPNLSNFLSPLNPLFATFGAYIYGDYLRRIVDSGDAFDYDDIPINFFFTTQDGFLNAIDFINNSNLTQFNDPPETYDSIQQHLVTYTLSKKSTSTLPSNYPQTITINLHGQYYGEPKNILSQLDLVNAKIAYNPQYTVDTHNILIDSRFTTLEGRGVIHIDVVKQSIRERLLKFLVDNSKVYKLDGRSSYKFIKWVANRSAFSESMQSLYQYLLTVSSISSDDQNLLDNIERSLSERLFNDPSNTPISLTTQFAETNNNVNMGNQNNNAVVIAQQGTGNAGRNEATPQGTRNEGTRNVGGGQITQQGTGNVGGGY